MYLLYFDGVKKSTKKGINVSEYPKGFARRNHTLSTASSESYEVHYSRARERNCSVYRIKENRRDRATTNLYEIDFVVDETNFPFTTDTKTSRRSYSNQFIYFSCQLSFQSINFSIGIKFTFDESHQRNIKFSSYCDFFGLSIFIRVFPNSAILSNSVN